MTRRRRKFNDVARAAFIDALRRMQAKGYTRLSANCLANELWPNARCDNAHGQSHNMAAGIAGQMLRSIRGCHEVENRVWEIVPEFIEQQTVAKLHNDRHSYQNDNLG